jgi:hypothetical protein
MESELKQIQIEREIEIEPQIELKNWSQLIEEQEQEQD